MRHSRILSLLLVLATGLLSGTGLPAQQLTESNVAQFEVTEPGFLFADGAPIFDATFTTGGKQLVVEPLPIGGIQLKSDFWVHGLQAGDVVTVTAPGHERKTVVYHGEPVVDMWLYRTSSYTVKPAPLNLSLNWESANPVSAAVMNDQLYFAYSLYWPSYPLVVGCMGGGTTQLSEGSLSGASLAAWNGNLFMAWQGINNNLLNIIKSSDGGRTWGNKVTLPMTTSTRPTLAVINGRLAMAWTQVYSGQINVAFSTDGHTWTGQQALRLSSALSPALASFGGKLVLAYVNTAPAFTGNSLALGLASWDGAQWDYAPFLPDTSGQGPSLSVVGGKLMLTWSGLNNNRINTYEVDTSLSVANKRTYDLVSPKTPVLVDYRAPQATPSVGLAMLLYNFNGDAGENTRFFDDGSFTPPNNDFESGLADWNRFSVHPDFAPYVSSKAASGTWSLEEDQNGIVYTDVSGLDAGKTYQISAFTSSSPGSTAAAVLWAHDTTGGNEVVGPNVQTQGWQRTSINFTADATGKVRIHLMRTEGSGAVYWDTVSIAAL